MSPGPLRRITATVGLLAMAPIAVMLLTSALTPQEAAIRAIVLVLAVVLVGNLVRIILTQLLYRVERDLPDLAEDASAAGGGAPGPGAGRAAPATGAQQHGVAGGDTPRRRAEDQVDAGRR